MVHCHFSTAINAAYGCHNYFQVTLKYRKAEKDDVQFFSTKVSIYITQSGSPSQRSLNSWVAYKSSESHKIVFIVKHNVEFEHLVAESFL